jgi:hypothetical protein
MGPVLVKSNAANDYLLISSGESETGG